MITRAVRTSVFKKQENLVAFIQKSIPSLKDGSILAITSKVVALSEGRVVAVKSEAQKQELIRKESVWQFETDSPWWLTVRDGSMVVNAGIDESNADGKIVLLPKDSFKAADRLRKQLMSLYKVKSFGVVITDSRISPLRAGVTGLAVGYAGFKGIRDYRGKKDIFGRKMSVTMTDVADSLATAATLVMGEGTEQQPLAIIEGAPVEFTERANPQEVQIPLKDDLYAPLFTPTFLKKRGVNLPVSRPSRASTRTPKRKE